ncbi:MAG TPA: hypothetical protein VFY40_05065 [Blastocatellia bacterium]|nr:hypothetical protein [Blastocatellia bacterium]
MIDVADMDLNLPRLESRRVQQQPHVHAVIVFEAQPLYKRTARGDDSAQRLFYQVCRLENPI